MPPRLLFCLLGIGLTGCRCTSEATVCALAAAPTTLPAGGDQDRLPALAQAPGAGAVAWIAGPEDRAVVRLLLLDAQGSPTGQPRELGHAGPPPRLVAVARASRRTAVVWTAGDGEGASLHGALIEGQVVHHHELAPAGRVVDPTTAFLGDRAWAVWGSGGALQARQLAPDAAAATELVPAARDAFWPLLVQGETGPQLAYLTGAGGLDLRLGAARTLDDLRGPSLRIPRALHLARLEPALAADGRGVVLAWSQVAAAPPGAPPAAEQIQLARVLDGRVTHLETTVEGLAPTVAPAGAGSSALAWVQRTSPTSGRLRFAIIDPAGGRPRPLEVDAVDPALGRPALARTATGYLLVWARPAPVPRGREIRLARITCR